MHGRGSEGGRWREKGALDGRVVGEEDEEGLGGRGGKEGGDKGYGWQRW